MTRLRTLSLIAASLALAAGTAASAGTMEQRGEARLARMLAGRTAGEPVSCIVTMQPNNLQVIDGVGFVYESGRTIYVARTTEPHMLRSTDIPIVERTNGSQLCAIDPIRTVDRYVGNTTGVIFLQDFVPYTKEG